MAFAAAGTQSMTVTFRDRENNSSTVEFFVPAAALTEDVETFATTDLITTLTGVSDAFIESVTINKRYENDTFVLPPETSDVERKASVVWRAQDRTSSKSEIPSVKNSLVLDGTQFINTSDAAWVAFQAMMVDAGLIDVHGLANYRGVKLIGIKSAPRKIHRGSAKG